MENLGPRPAVRPDTPPTLSKARFAVLKLLSDHGEPMTAQDVADRMGAHVNTSRAHLDGLAEAGLVDRGQRFGPGRGRPSWTYQAVPEGAQHVREYRGLATALARYILKNHPEPRTAAISAGEEWGAELAAQAEEITPTAAPPDADPAARLVIDLLDHVGFAPQSSQLPEVRLLRCPLLEAARRYPQVVCAVHLGIVRGALTAAGGDPDRAQLTAFAEPGACRLHLDTPPATL